MHTSRRSARRRYVRTTRLYEWVITGTKLNNRNSRRFPLPNSGGDHWKECHDIVDGYDTAACQRWNDDINTLLVFVSSPLDRQSTTCSHASQTGVFSGAVTAFAIESYQWLQPDHPADTVLILSHISLQLASTNETAYTSPIFSASPADRRVNIFWFLSLIVTLMTALLGILCKQWIREYQQDAALPFRESVSMRQMRFDGLTFWRVEEMISFLPLLLQLGLLLFVLAVLDLLWQRDRVTAACISVAALVGFGVVFVTTILPVVVLLYNSRFVAVDQDVSRSPSFGSEHKHGPSPKHIPPCPYKSPQAWIFLRLVSTFHRRLGRIHSWLGADRDILTENLVRYSYSAALWINEHYAHTERALCHVARCLIDLPPRQHPSVSGRHASYNDRAFKFLASTESANAVTEDHLHDRIILTHLVRRPKQVETFSHELRVYLGELYTCTAEHSPTFLASSSPFWPSTVSTGRAWERRHVELQGESFLFYICL